MERSHDKMRPSLPRSRELPAVLPTAPERPRQRDAHGRFTPGNHASLGRGAKAALRRLLGRGNDIADADAAQLARDAERLFAATLAELPSDGATVRQLAASFARHSALQGFWAARAAELGLSSDEAVKAEEHASKHGARAERLAISMLDVASRLRRQERHDPLASIRDAIVVEADK